MADLFNSIWRDVFRDAPTLSQEDVLLVFDDMDAILATAVSTILMSESVIKDLMELAAPVAGSLSHGKGIFERAALQVGDLVDIETDQERRGGLVVDTPLDAARKLWKVKWPSGQTETVELRTLKRVGSKPAKEPRQPTRSVATSVLAGSVYRFKNKPDLDAITFLAGSLAAFAAWSDGSVQFSHMGALQLSRASYEQILEKFFKRTAAYEALSLESARLRIVLHEAARDDVPPLLERLSAITEELFEIEQQVGFNGSLWRVVGDLRVQWKQYCRLREKIFIPYMRVVFDEAKKRAASEIQIIENFQNGAAALMNAISKYNRKRGVFSSYARVWAMQGILWRLKEEANAIKLPPAVWQTAAQLQDVVSKMAAENPDQEVNMAEAAAMCGLDEERAEKILERVRATQMLSIDFQPDDPDAQSLHETLEAEVTDDDPEIVHYLDGVPEMSKKFLFLNYGLFDRLPGQPPSDPDLLARERLRQTAAGSVKRSSTRRSRDL